MLQFNFINSFIPDPLHVLLLAEMLRQSQGYLIGNGVTDPEIDGNALVSFARFKSLISAGLHSAIVAQCNGSYWDAQPGVFLPPTG